MLCKNCKTLIIQCKIIKGIRLFLDLDENHQQIPSNVAQYSMDNGMLINNDINFKDRVDWNTYGYLYLNYVVKHKYPDIFQSTLSLKLM